MIKEARIASLLPLFPLPQYVVILEDLEKTHLVPIWIGLSEGNAIALEMQGEKFPRPLTHDLMASMLKAMNAQVEKVIVSDLKESSYYAVIELKVNGQTLSLDARPSDSLALAVRVHCPIYIDEKVLEKCPPIHSQITQEEVEKFKNDLKTLTPEEFFKNLESAPSAEEQGLMGPMDGPMFGSNEEGPSDEDAPEEDGEEGPQKGF